MNIGIYLLYWKEDDSKVYIGKSTDIKNRINRRHYELANNSHENYKLQNMYNKYGDPSYIILDTCNSIDLSTKEVQWISEFDSYANGYNLTTAEDLNGHGTSHSASLYTKFQILKVFSMLYKGLYSFKQISFRTGVKIASINAICKGINHTWLSHYLDKYNKMLSIERLSINKKPKREDYTKILGKYPQVMSPIGTIYTIAKYGSKAFAILHNLNPKRLNELLHGDCKTHKGWYVYLDK